MDSSRKIVSRSVTNLMLVGVLLALVGALILLARLLAGEPVAIDAVNAWCGASVLVGVVILSFRYGVILDRQKRTSTKWRGLWIPFHKSEAHRLSKACYVSITNKSTIDPSKAGLLDNAIGAIVPINQSLAVELQEPGVDATTLYEVQEYDEARRFAEEIAKFLDVGLRDRSSTVEVVREAGELDLPLQEQLSRTGPSTPLPARIEGARAIFRYGGIGASSSIELPPAGMSGRAVLKAIVGVCGLSLISFGAFTKRRSNWDADTLLYLLLIPFVIASVLAVRVLIRAFAYREHLVVSPEEIVITRHGLAGPKTTRLSSAEVEEVALIAMRYPKSFHDSMSRVVIRSDRGSIELGATLLQAEEVRWLRDVLLHVLAPSAQGEGHVASA